MSNKITIKDLCPEEKKKIGELLKRLSTETDEKQKLKQMIEEDKRLYESKINSLKELSIQSANYNDYKSESFAQSFIGNTNAKETKPNPSVNDIQTLRVKFDELYETVKKAAKTNDTILSKIQRDSFVEDKPVFDLPKPIEQNINILNNVEDDSGNSVCTNNNNNNILQISFTDDIKKYGDNDKSFISSNEDMFNGLLSSSKKNKTENNCNYTNVKRYNIDNENYQGMLMSRNSNSNSNKYKEMLGRIREKSQEQHSNVNSKQPSNQYRASKVQCQLSQNNNNNNEVSISHSIQLNIPSENKNINREEFEITSTHTLNAVAPNKNSNSICENNEYKSVLNLLHNNTNTITKLSSSTIQNENLQTSTSIQSSISSKLEDVANANLFNYIFSLEKKPEQMCVNQQENPILETKIVNVHDNNQYEIDNVEKEINSLHERTMENSKVKAASSNNKKGYKTKYAKGCNKLYEDFTKINSKYI